MSFVSKREKREMVWGRKYVCNNLAFAKSLRESLISQIMALGKEACNFVGN